MLPCQPLSPTPLLPLLRFAVHCTFLPTLPLLFRTFSSPPQVACSCAFWEAIAWEMMVTAVSGRSPDLLPGWHEKRDRDGTCLAWCLPGLSSLPGTLRGCVGWLALLPLPSSHCSQTSSQWHVSQHAAAISWHVVLSSWGCPSLPGRRHTTAATPHLLYYFFNSFRSNCA